MSLHPLTATECFLQQEIAPIATQLDQDPVALQQAFLAMGDRNLLALRIPQTDQGQGLNEITFCRFQEQVARYSGALAFLQTQHQSAASWLAQSSNLALKQTYLPSMGSGKVRIALDQELQACRTAIYQAHPEGEIAHRLELRAWLIDLAVRCAHTAVAVSRGAANYASHPAQRIYREALAFTVFGQTTAIMEATLKRLTRSQSLSNRESRDRAIQI